MARVLFDLGLFSVLTSGVALGSGWKLNFYTGGTSTQITTYNARSGGSANANPVIADANGRFDEIWITDYQTIKWVLTDAADVVKVTVDDYVIDQVPVATDANLAGFLANASATPLAVAYGGTGATTDTNARTNLGLGSVATLAETTTAQYLANTADKALSTDQVWAAGATVALTDAATVAVDMSLGLNFTLAIGGNRTLGAPTNPKQGQSGFIEITQDATGSRTLAYHANWVFDNGSDPVLSTAANTKDVLYYTVHTATRIHGTLRKAVA